ncbi:MAG: GNAT family N-acetyltransferase [Burkholderiaceae bacterium]
MEPGLTPLSVEPMQALTAGDLVLEPLVAGHAEAMFEVLGDPALYRYLDHPAPPSVEHLREVYAGVEKRLSPDGSQVWLNWVVRRAGEPPLGYVQATLLMNHTAWVGYVFSARHWGRGHATQAGRAMLEHLSIEHGVHRFLASVEAGNLRSIRLLERLGFREAQGQALQGHDLTPSERLYVR